MKREGGIKDTLDLLGVEVRHKSSSKLMRFLGWFLGLWGLDFQRFWTTIGPRVIYAPDRVRLDDLDRYETILRHELVHIAQARRWPIFWQISYVLLPLPFFFAWFRWRWEREAYLVDIEAGRMTVEQVVQVLWKSYGWTWPKGWMRRWFERRPRGD